MEATHDLAASTHEHLTSYEPHVDALHIARHYDHDQVVTHLENHIAATEHLVARDEGHQAELDRIRREHAERMGPHDEL